MLYRIDLQHYLTHAIDYFTREELMHFRYVLISAHITNLSKQGNVVKQLNLWPTTEIIDVYESTKDVSLMEKMYMDLLTIDSPEDEWIGDLIYKTFVNPLLFHKDQVIVCDRTENVYIDVLCKHLKKSYAIDVIDLNKLFSEGKIGPLYIDRKKIHNKAVDIRRIAAKKSADALETTREGRLSLLEKMNKTEKVKKLKELGISAKKSDNLNAMLIDAWVNDDEEGD